MDAGKIRVLPPEVIGQIAAGEVVERPAAAIKELVENSIDAHATAVTVEIRDGGLTYFRVTDNGDGIQPEDIRLAFARHATSKIRTAGDLYGVRSLGFRGEALASIAAVAKVTCLTRARGRDVGIKAVNEGGDFTAIEDAACPEGTSLTVRDLFFNAPVRRKFLKKSTAEAAYVSDLMERLILSRPDVSFRFVSDGKTAFFSAGDGKIENACLSVFGLNALKMMVPVSGCEGGIQLEGLVGIGEASRGNRSREYFFLNHRTMRSGLLSAALEDACRQLVTIGRFPICALHLTMPYENADVNVHPNKWEVRFANEQAVRQSVQRIISDALLRDRHTHMRIPTVFQGSEHPAAPVATQPSPAAPVSSGRAPARSAMSDTVPQQAVQTGTAQPKDAPRPAAHAVPPQGLSQRIPLSFNGLSSGADDLFAAPVARPLALRETPFAPPVPAHGGTVSVFSPAPAGESAASLQPVPVSETAAPSGTPSDAPVPLPPSDVETPPSENAAVSEALSDAAPAATLISMDAEQTEQPQVSSAFRDKPLHLIGVAFDTYIILQYEDRLLLCDQHAIHERLLYEKFTRQTDRDSFVQPLLIPRAIKLTRTEYNAFIENTDALHQAGFDAEEFGDTTVQLRGVPMLLGQPEAESCFLGALDELADGGAISRQERVSRIIQMACKHAVKGGERLPQSELIELVRRMLTEDIRMTCPHGRPLMIELTRTDLEKRFKRIQN